MDFIQIQLKARTSAQHVYMHPKAQPEVKIPPPQKKYKGSAIIHYK